jgi:glutamate carboxypeptidase
MEAFLATLVNLDSGSHDKAGVDAVGEAILAFLGEDGIAVERSAVSDCGDVLRAAIPGAEGAGPALLLGHRDTVFPKGTARDRPFSKHGDLGFGPGVADMKGGLVVTCFLLRAFARASEPPPFPIVALFTGDEEIGSGTGRPFIEAEARHARAVFNLEPGRVSGNVVTARKGGLTLTIEARGKAAHAGVNHADGASAIDCLARKIVRLHGLTDYASGITANVGVITGGVSTTPGAPLASAGLDLRYTSLDQVEPLLAAVAAIVAAEDGVGTSATFRRESGFLPMEARWSGDLMDRYRAQAARLGFTVAGEFTGGCSDAGFTASLGVPTLCGLGPVGGKAHTDAEFCRLDTLVPRAQALAGAILSLAEA